MLALFNRLSTPALKRLCVITELKDWVEAALRKEGGVRPADVEAGVQVPVLRRLVTFGIAVVDGTIQLAAGEYNLGEGSQLQLQTKGMRLLGEEGVAITRSVNREFLVEVRAEFVVIEKVAILPGEGSDCGAVAVDTGSAAAKDCDLRGQVKSKEGAELLLQKCTIHAAPRSPCPWRASWTFRTASCMTARWGTGSR